MIVRPWADFARDNASEYRHGPTYSGGTSLHELHTVKLARGLTWLDDIREVERPTLYALVSRRPVAGILALDAPLKTLQDHLRERL